MAQTHNTSAVQGDTHSVLTRYVDSNGAAINLSGYSAKLQVKETYDGTALVTLTQLAGLAIDGAAGTITITFTAAQTGALAVGIYLYDLQITSPGGVVTTLIEGRFSILPQVTT